MSRSRHDSRLRSALRQFVAMLVVIVLGAGVIWSFIEGQSEREIEEAREAPVNAPLRVAMVGNEPIITLDAAARESSGLQTVQLQSAQHQAQIQAYGTVLDLQPLTELSNSYSTTKAQLQTAQAKLNASRTAFERAQRLFNDQQNISAAQLQAAEAAFRVDEASVAGAETQLQNLAATAVQQWGTVLGRALVDRTPTLLRLLQRQEVLIQVTLAPGQKLAEPPSTAIAEPDAATHATIRFVSPAPRTDARIQGVSFFYTAPATSGLLPGMNVLVLLASGRAEAGALVPASAVVWTEGRAWAYFRTGEQTFARREIPTEIPASDGGYVVTRLPGNSEIVAQGAQLLLSEEFRSQIQVGEE
jgi:hypothetical protein